MANNRQDPPPPAPPPPVTASPPPPARASGAQDAVALRIVEPLTLRVLRDHATERGVTPEELAHDIIQGTLLDQQRAARDPNCFAVTLPEPIADWVREAARRHGIAPGQYLVSLVAAAPLGGDTFTVALKASEAAWVRDAAAQRRMRPADLVRALVAQGRAADPSKGGTIAKTGDQAELQRLAAAAGQVA